VVLCTHAPALCCRHSCNAAFHPYPFLCPWSEQAFIPRCLEEVSNYERDQQRVLAAGGADVEGVYYQAITGMRTDLSGARTVPALLDGVSKETEHSSAAQDVAAVTDACLASAAGQWRASNSLNSASSSGSDDDDSDSEADSEIGSEKGAVDKDAVKAARKANKKAVKEAAREKRKTKTPKHIKKSKTKGKKK